MFKLFPGFTELLIDQLFLKNVRTFTHIQDSRILFAVTFHSPYVFNIVVDEVMDIKDEVLLEKVPRKHRYTGLLVQDQRYRLHRLY